jgi:CAAX protease family protein
MPEPEQPPSAPQDPSSEDPSAPAGHDPYLPSDAEVEGEGSAPAFLQRPGPALGVGCGGCVGYFALAQIVPSIVVVALILGMGGSLKNIEPQIIEYLWLITGLGVLVSIGIVVASRKLGWLDEGPASPEPRWKAFAWALGATVACPLGAQAISLFQAEVLQIPMQEQQILVDAAKTAGIGFWLAIVVGAPLGEELFFRRWFYGITRKPLGPWFAFMASGLAFAIVHGNFSAFLGYLWIAGCCTLAYERSGSIWAAVGVHFVNNSIAAFMLSQA